jgi:hypothetical protein
VATPTCRQSLKSLAKSICGTTGGLYPSRVSGPRYRVEREIVATNSAQLFCLLSAVTNAFSLGQRRPGAQGSGAAGTGARGSDSTGRGIRSDGRSWGPCPWVLWNLPRNGKGRVPSAQPTDLKLFPGVCKRPNLSVLASRFELIGAATCPAWSWLNRVERFGECGHSIQLRSLISSMKRTRTVCARHVSMETRICGTVIHLTVDLPLAGSDKGLPCSVEMNRSRRCSLYAGSVVLPMTKEFEAQVPTAKRAPSIFRSPNATTLTRLDAIIAQHSTPQLKSRTVIIWISKNDK